MKIIGEVNLSSNKNNHELSSFHAIFYFVFIILFLTQTLSFSQKAQRKKVLTLKEKNSLKLIHEIEHFGRRELKLKLHHHFYTQWQFVEQPNTYLYVSRADSILLPPNTNAFQFFGTDTLAAKLAADSITNAGLDAMIYRTSGNSAVRLTHQLLNYPQEAIIFIVLHEMAHVHSNQKKLKKSVFIE
jgi:Zn-dependent protease with chaperone function